VTKSASNDGSSSKTRLEAFSDGVFAIAITLLVLEIAVKPGGSPLDEFLSAWPAYVGYVISFITIGVAWIGQSAITEELTKVDAVFLRLNLLLLALRRVPPVPDQTGRRPLRRSRGRTRSGDRLRIHSLKPAYMHLCELHSVRVIPRMWMSRDPAVMSATPSPSCLAPSPHAGLGRPHRAHQPGAPACPSGSPSSETSVRARR
jgi:Endosomal/lysosomal potassium channel TMEM175